MSINVNKLAIQIAQIEGKKHQVNIADIKEVLRITLILIARSSPDERGDLFKRYKLRRL